MLMNMRKNKNSLLFSHVICKRLFTANKEVLENLKKMEVNITI